MTTSKNRSSSGRPSTMKSRRAEVPFVGWRATAGRGSGLFAAPNPSGHPGLAPSHKKRAALRIEPGSQTTEQLRDYLRFLGEQFDIPEEAARR